jgi:hypothetical protein
MALDNENLNPEVRSSNTPMEPEPKRSAPESPSKTIKQSRAILEVQFPSTLPQHDQEDGPVEKGLPHIEQIRSDPSEIPTEDDHEAETADVQPDPNAELLEMNWEEFQERYQEAIVKANVEEAKLLEEFEKYFEVRKRLHSPFQC